MMHTIAKGKFVVNGIVRLESISPRGHYPSGPFLIQYSNVSPLHSPLYMQYYKWLWMGRSAEYHLHVLVRSIMLVHASP